MHQQRKKNMQPVNQKAHNTFQPLDLRFDWKHSLKGQHTQLKTSPRQGLDEELHSVIEWELILKSPHTVIIKEGRLLSVGHLSRMGIKTRKMGKQRSWTTTMERGIARWLHCCHTSCKTTSSAMREEKKQSSPSKLKKDAAAHTDYPSIIYSQNYWCIVKSWQAAVLNHWQQPKPDNVMKKSSVRQPNHVISGERGRKPIAPLESH